MTLKTGRQIITIHILPNISRSKADQKIKFGQLWLIWIFEKKVSD